MVPTELHLLVFTLCVVLGHVALGLVFVASRL